jgi:hypothetical protein
MDQLMFILDLLLERPGRDKRLYESKSYPFIPVHSQVLRAYIHDYDQYLRYMIEVGVIEQSSAGYSVGKKSKAYRIRPLYRTRTVEVALEDKRFIGHIQEVIRRENASADQQVPYLTRWIPGLRINLGLARRFAEAFLEKGTQNSLTRYQAQKLYCQHANLYQSMHRIAAGFHYSKVDESGHRLHTVLTNLKSGLRHGLTFQGQLLVGIDLACSQVYL